MLNSRVSGIGDLVVFTDQAMFFDLLRIVCGLNYMPSLLGLFTLSICTFWRSQATNKLVSIPATVPMTGATNVPVIGNTTYASTDASKEKLTTFLVQTLLQSRLKPAIPVLIFSGGFTLFERGIGIW